MRLLFVVVVQCLYAIVYSQHLLFVNNYSNLVVQSVGNRSINPVLPTLQHLQDIER